MPFPPQPSNLGNSFATSPSSSSSNGFGDAESQLPNYRPATSTRNIMHWLLPQGNVVQMYINPQNVSYNYKKNITPTRTKGGYTIQYWGEELTVLHLSGTTGTSGIEGINVLSDLYRNEQIQFDPYALFLAAQYSQSLYSPASIGSSDALSPGASIASTLLGAAESVLPASIQPPPSLASMAFTVELYWSGEVYRGYFSDFMVRESVDQLGLFSYEITFTVTQKRGLRQNFLAWQRSPDNGPSNSDPQFGTPYSFGSLSPTSNQATSTSNNTISSSETDPFDIF